MRLALVATCLHPVPPRGAGAVETQVLAQARALVERGHQVDLLTVADAGSPERDDRAGGAGLVYHRLRPAYASGPPGLVRLMWAERDFARRAIRRLDELGPLAVIWHARGPCAAALARGSRQPLLFQAHNWKNAEGATTRGLGPRRFAGWRAARLERRIAGRADRLLAVSQFLRERIAVDSGRALDAIELVPNVVELERFGPDPAVARRPGSVLFVGRVAEEKGVLPLIEALARVPRATLSVVGPEAGGTERGAYARRCRARVAALGLGDRVRFVGELPRSELAAHYRRAAAVAVPSVWNEPCGLVALEALASGTPVIASRVGGLVEAVEEQRTGRLVAPADVDAWAVALAETIADERLARIAAVEGPRRIAERHGGAGLGARLERACQAAIESWEDRR